MNKDGLIKKLADALIDAKEHLDYIGYGDSWERECAKASGLEGKIDSALNDYEVYCEEEQ